MSSKIQFTKGEFQTFRVTTQVHLGRLERYLAKDDEIEFDGHTLKFEGAEHSIPQLRGAVLSGWLVPSSDTTSVYTPAPANITIRPAQAANIDNRGKAMPVVQAQDDNVVVGRVKTAETVDTANTAENADAGSSVAKISTPARQKTYVSDTSAAQSEINRLDNTPPPKATKVATGDVETATAGDTLEEILPEAASTSTPTPTKSKTKAAKSKVVTLENGVEWDMGRHWRTRGRDATKSYGTDTETLGLIQNVEVPSVVKMISERLNKS